MPLPIRVASSQEWDGNETENKRLWYQGWLHHRRLREQAEGLDVLVEMDCDEGEDPTQEEIDW